MPVKDASGYNPIRYRCSVTGCYLTECQPSVEWFRHCFPGKISMSDMDRIVEIAGRALVLEWKGPGGQIGLGQRIMWERLTRGKMLTVIAVEGDAKTMAVDKICHCWNGRWGEWINSSLLELNERLTNWAKWANANPVFSIAVNVKDNTKEGTA